MTAAGAHLVTGATGPLGAAISLRLLRRADATVYCLVRGRGEEECAARLREALRAAGADRELAGPCVALPGDVTAESCGVATEQLPSPGPVEAWHCAEDRRSAKRYSEEVERCNIAGTANVLAFAQRFGVRRFNLLSTAGVAGTSVGPVAERPLPVEHPTNDVYERSKLEAEALAQAGDFEAVRLLRPAAVVADAGAGREPLDRALLAFAERLLRFRQEVDEQLGDYFAYRHLTVSAAPETRFWLSPVGLVAEAAARLAIEAAPGGPRHLVASDSPTLGEVISAAFAAAGMLPPRFSDDPRQLNRIDEAFNRSLRFHHPSWLQAKELDGEGTARLLGADALVSGIGKTGLVALLTAHLEAARERLAEPAEGVAA